MANLFTDLFTSDNEKEAAAQKAAGLQAGRTEAYGQLDSGYNTAAGLYGKGIDAFAGLLDRGNRGYDTYLDATGVNGQAGIDRAGSLFKSLPGYSGGLNTGLDLLERRAAARGDLGGGNTSADTIKYASDYDAQKYKDFLTGLAPNIGTATTATTGTAGLYGQQGNLANQVGGQKAQYGYGTEKGIGDANAEATMANEKASQNFWGALLGGAKLASSFF